MIVNTAEFERITDRLDRAEAGIAAATADRWRIGRLAAEIRCAQILDAAGPGDHRPSPRHARPRHLRVIQGGRQ